MKTCPYCGQQIRDKAIKCRWCRRDLAVPVPGGQPAVDGQSEEEAPNAGPGTQQVEMRAASTERGPRSSVSPPSQAAEATALPEVADVPCPRCGAVSTPGNRFCGDCGAPAVPSPQSSARVDVVATPVPARAAARRARFLDALASPERVFRYLAMPVLGAVLGGLGLLALGIASAGAAYAIDPDLLAGETNKVLLVLRNGGLFAYAFLRVPFFRDSASTFGPIRTEATLVPLTGLLLVAIVLFAAGGFVARRVQGSRGTKVVAGAATALPLALASFLAPIVFPNPTGAGVGPVGAWAPFRVSAFLLPLLWAGVFGALGGMRAVFGRRWLRRLLTHAEPAVRAIVGSLRGALSGISWGIVLGVIVSAITIAILAIEHPTERRDVFGDVRTLLGTVSGILLFLPNLAATALLASMGVPVQVQGGLEPFPLETATYGYAHNLPAYAWAALLVPAVVVLRMGYRAAGSVHGDARTAVVSGLAAAMPFTLACWALAFLSAVYVREDGAFLNVRLSPVGALVLPLLWGLIGGWLGALLFIHRSRGAGGDSDIVRGGVGAALGPEQQLCPACGTANPASDSFCGMCGESLSPMHEGS